MYYAREQVTSSWIIRGWLALSLLVVLASCSGSDSSPASSLSSQADTVAGVDTNTNGVRDDVEQYIAKTYADPALAQTNAALMQYAQVLQSTIVDASTAATATASVAAQRAQDMVNAVQCLGARRPDDFAILLSELRMVALDTSGRQQAYLKAAQMAEGAVSQMQFMNFTNWSSACL